MKEILINKDNLTKEEINEKAIRVKGLLINNKNEIMLGYANKIYQFPGGHVKENESLIDALFREIKEETGIGLTDKTLKPFIKITYYYRNYRNTTNNRQNDIYYYIIKTNEQPNENNTSLDDYEKEGNYTIKTFPLQNVEKVLKENKNDNEINKIIVEEMLRILNEYKKITDD